MQEGMTVILVSSILLMLPVVTTVSTLKITREKEDIFTFPALTGNDCKLYDGYWKSSTSCKCEYNKGTLFGTNGNNYKCNPSVGECSVDVGNMMITLEKNDKSFQISNCPSCNKIQKIYIWNIASTGDLKGIWTETTNRAKTYVDSSNKNVLIYTSRMDASKWAGQLLKIMFNGNSCLLLKAAGQAHYPFDINTLFVQPTSSPTITVLKPTTLMTTRTTKIPTLSPKTQSTQLPSLPPTQPPSLPPTQPPSLPPTQSSSLQSTLQIITQFSSSTKGGESGASAVCAPQKLPTWVIVIIIILTILVIVLLLVVYCLCRRGLNAAKKEKNKSFNGTVTYQSRDDFQDKRQLAAKDMALDNECYTTVGNINCTGSKDIYLNDHYTAPIYEPSDGEYMYTIADNVNRNSSQASQPISMVKTLSTKALIENEEEQEPVGYATLGDFSDEIYSDLKPTTESAYDNLANSAGSYLSMHAGSHGNDIESNPSVKI